VHELFALPRLVFVRSCGVYRTHEPFALPRLVLCRHVVFVHDYDAWVQRRCSVGRMMCAQLPLDSLVWRRWQLPNQADLAKLTDVTLLRAGFALS
jgi:hypothetical protein